MSTTTTTNYNMALIILFAFMGIALVILLIVLNLTVSIGTINGLLFTANYINPSFWVIKLLSIFESNNIMGLI